MSNLVLHEKAFLLLIDYSELEQYEPMQNAPQVMQTYQNIMAELRTLRTHLIYSHGRDDTADLLQDVNDGLDSLSTYDQNLRKLYYSRIDVGDS